jgi:hypothetical protein
MVDQSDKLEKVGRDDDERRLRRLEELADDIVGPANSANDDQLAIRIPEIAQRPPGYFKQQALMAAARAAARYIEKGEPVPNHVRFALASASQRKPALERTNGDLIEAKLTPAIPPI